MADEDARRLGLTLNAKEYARVRAYARQAGRPVATIAKRLLLGAIDHDDTESAAAVERDRARIKQLEDEVMRLQAELDQRQVTADIPPALPRWRWPLDALLADRAWWGEWLPSLAELLGRNVADDRGYGDSQAELPVDERGFADVVEYLFPEMRDERGARVPWHSADYGRCARAAWESARSTPSLRQRPVRAEVWEPVVRHVALALTAIETTSQTPNDAYTHLRVEAEIRGEWMRTLCAMLGAERLDHLTHLSTAALG